VPREQVCTACRGDGHNKRTCPATSGAGHHRVAVPGEVVRDPHRLLARAVVDEALRSVAGRREIAAGHPDLRAWCLLAGLPWEAVARLARGGRP
jgi:hypothetical protein